MWLSTVILLVKFELNQLVDKLLIKWVFTKLTYNHFMILVWKSLQWKIMLHLFMIHTCLNVFILARKWHNSSKEHFNIFKSRHNVWIEPIVYVTMIPLGIHDNNAKPYRIWSQCTNKPTIADNKPLIARPLEVSFNCAGQGN